MSTWPIIETEDSDADDGFLAQQCRRFRILVMGKSGVGKSTLLSMVFGIPEHEAGVRHQGEGKGQHSVWNGQVSRNNPLLIIHDSGGFEPAETSNLNEIKRFIWARTRKPELENQLHCIWYCIECDDPRFWSEAETKFLEFFRNSQVPIVFVLTKFDKVVKECTIDRLRSGGSETVNWTAAEKLAVGDAREQINENICRKLEQIVGGGVKSEIISNEDPNLVKKLVEETTSIVKPNLKYLWIGAQRVVADKKREGAISDSVKAMTTRYVRMGMLIPIPFIKPLLHQDIFIRIYDIVRFQWNILDLGLLQIEANILKFREMCQGASRFSHLGSALTTVVDPTGPLSGPHYISKYLRWAVDLNLLFEMLFWKVTKQGEESRPSKTGHGNEPLMLRADDLDDILAHYKFSRLRLKAHAYISGQVHNFNLSLPFKRVQLREILAGAVETITGGDGKEDAWARTQQLFSQTVTPEEASELQ